MQNESANLCIQDMTAGLTIDQVTGLYQSKAFWTEVEKAIEKSPEAGLAYYVMDIDNFTLVENSSGRLYGNEIMKQIADGLRQIFHFKGVIGQLGDDKFAVAYQEYDSKKQVEEKAQEICRKVRGIYTGTGQDFILSMSIGVCYYPEQATTKEKMEEKAEKALAYQKNHGKDGYQVYSVKCEEQKQCGRYLNREQALVRYMEEKNIEIKGYDEFGYELVELGFSLMEDIENIDNTIDMLLHKVGAYYGLDTVAVRRIINKPRTMRYVYEYLKSDDIPVRKELEWQYTEKEWALFLEHFKDGYYLYYKNEGKEFDMPSIENASWEFQTFMEVPIYQSGKLLGCIDYICFYEKKHLTESVMRTLTMFAKIISTYLVNARNYSYTTQKIEQLSDYDALTGLMKYDVFVRKVKQFIKNGMIDSKIVVMYSDLQNFKYINEAYGYDMGNKLLQKFSDRMSKDVKRLIAAARVYSDNLVMAVEYSSDVSDDDVFQYVCRENVELSRSLQKDFMDNNICICTGIAIVENPDQDVQIVVSNANMARKEAKKRDTQTVVMFDDVMMKNVMRQMQLNAELPEALRNNEIKVYYQPKIESGTGKIVGGEALVRWIKDDGKMIYPDEFIPGFEENGMIVEIDYFVYEAVFKKIKERLDEKKPVVPVSMNISRVHLREVHDFMEYIRYLFEKYPVPSEYIEFELTESIYIENLEPALALIRDLRKMGIRISMDDFGSGYSSLNTLNNLPIDILKLDKVFLNGGELTASQKIIISSVVEMASKLNIHVVCEGVETAEQVQFLTVIGCDMIQGYYYAKPMPEDDFVTYIDTHFKVKSKIVNFTFNGTLTDVSGEITGSYISGSKGDVEYTEGPFENSKALLLRGGLPADGIVDIPIDFKMNSSYTLTCWAKVDKRSTWTSLLYMRFENGFLSVIPSGGDLLGDFRIKNETEPPEIWHDTGSSALIDDEWHFYAATYNAQTKVAVFYIDYRIVGYAESIPMLVNLRQFLVGGDIYARSFEGAIADVKVYNQSLSRTDVIDNFHQEEKKLAPRPEKVCKKR